MPRRPPDNDNDVSLFPFLSIIACLIGVLTVMISTLTLAQMDTKDIAVIEAWERTQKELSQSDVEIEQLTASIAKQLGPDGPGIRKGLVERQALLDKLLKQQKELQETIAKQKPQEVIIPTIDESLRETAASMQAELEEENKKIAQLKIDRKERKVASEAKVVVLPSGSGVRLTPHFVECAKGSIVMHTIDPPKLLRAADMVTDKDFIALLQTVANGTDDSVIFLIRSDGLATYRAAKKLCTDQDIRNGKLPAAGAGTIDLSRFAKKLKNK